MRFSISILLIAALAFIGSASGWSLVSYFQTCVRNYDDPLPNDALIGTWYLVKKFMIFDGVVPFASCPHMMFSKPTADELQEYREANAKAGHPYEIDDNSLRHEWNNRPNALTSGNIQAKYFVVNPNSPAVNGDGYAVHVYKRLTDDFMLMWECNAGVPLPWIMSKNRDVTDEELNAVIAGVSEVSNRGSQRYCA